MTAIRLIAPPGILNGDFHLPSSKSVCNRVLIIRAQCERKFEIQNLSDADDTRLLDYWINHPSAVEDCGAGGTTFRFLLALRAVQGRSCVLTGSDRLVRRPVKPLIDALHTLGADIECMGENNQPPVKVEGHFLKGGRVSIEAGISSQFISALLLVSPSMRQGLELCLSGKVVSDAYIQMTVELMQEFGVEVEMVSGKYCTAPSQYKPFDFVAPPDWSAAAYPYAMAALRPGSVLRLTGANTRSFQGDEIIRGWMRDWGVETTAEGSDLYISGKGIPLNRLEYNLLSNPDLAQPLAVLAAASGRELTLTGLSTLPGKETDRLAALKSELAKCGVAVDTGADYLSVKGKADPESVRSSRFEAFHDHRMVMSMSLLSLVAPSVILNDPGEVSKSFPAYFNVLQQLHFEAVPFS